MDERDIRVLLADVKRGRLSRRSFTRIMAGFGLSAPLASQLLAGIFGAQAKVHAQVAPMRRGGGGHFKALSWDAPMLLNPLLSLGVKDANAARVFYEPLVSFDPDGRMVPVLAEQIPSLENSGLARDGMSVTWKLKRDVSWHDGQPFTAADVVFNWEYAADPATASPAFGLYRNVKRVEPLDSHTVRVTFTQPTPFWLVTGLIIPKHIFEPYKGAKSRDAPNNLRPVGTGPYRYVEFRPGELLKAELNPGYRIPNQPFFDSLELRGGGDAVSAARAVLQTGEYDYAGEVGNVEDEILKRLEARGKGRVAIAFGGRLLQIQLNQTDPWTEVDGERSSIRTVHPFLTDPAVRSAMNLLVDRSAINDQIFGRTGRATANYINTPERFRSPNTRWEFNLEKANRQLDGGGWKRGDNGLRTKEGRKLQMLIQTNTSASREKIAAIVKNAAAKAGIEIETKSVLTSVFFASDPANPDTYTHFYADLQMLVRVMGPPDPEGFMRSFTSWEVASKENHWQRLNVSRWRSEQYDRLYRAAETEMDPVKRAALFIRMNDLVIENVVVIPVSWTAKAAAVSKRLRGVEPNAWDLDFWNLASWYRTA